MLLSEEELERLMGQDMHHFYQMADVDLICKSGGGDTALTTPADLQQVTAVGKPAVCTLSTAPL